MYRTHNCGELRLQDKGKQVTVAGWAQTVRNKGAVLWIDVRDRYGLIQLVFEEGVTDAKLLEEAAEVGREFVLQATGEVIERYNKNPNIPTGDIEIHVSELKVLNKAKTPPFLIEDETDGGDELRMKYRYLDLRRRPVRENMLLRHKVAQATRNYLSGEDFMEVETPVLIKSTPEGARDFVVPSRMNPGEFYALPQSPQTFKQLLMVSGFDRYFQIVKCFRDEDLRADRQPEFTQIDCEMAFVEQEDILNTFEGLIKHLFKTVKGIELGDFPRMTYDEAMERYGSDKPDIRFGMEFATLKNSLLEEGGRRPGGVNLTGGKDFKIFDEAEIVLAIAAPGCAEWPRKQLDALQDFVKRPQIGMKGMVWVKYNTDGTLKSTVDKFYSEEDLKAWAEATGAQPGDLMLVLSGDKDLTRKAMNELRMHMGNELGLRNNQEFAPLWVMDFPLLEWDEETKRYHAMHHPFTSPKPADMDKLESDPGAVRANAYDLAMNGVEIGGGSIRIHDRATQARMFKLLGFSDEEARAQFGFLMDAFEYGAPPHGGIAFGFDRLCSIMGGQQSIRDFIAFPKNNAGRDVMIDSPSPISEEQLKELELVVKKGN